MCFVISHRTKLYEILNATYSLNYLHAQLHEASTWSTHLKAHYYVLIVTTNPLIILTYFENSTRHGLSSFCS